MRQAGYAPEEAAAIWDALMKERDAGDDEQPLLFFSSHPSTQERVGTLRELAGKAPAAQSGATTGREEFLAAILPHRGMLLRDELRRRDFNRTSVLLDRLKEQGVDLGEIHFFRGEMYRVRNDDGDAARAIAAYEQAIATTAAPPETHRSLGLVLMKQGDKPGARAAFTEYLTRSPEADDREMVQAYVRQME
jgi:predicted Zn-dependent protease